MDSDRSSPARSATIPSREWTLFTSICRPTREEWTKHHTPDQAKPPRGNCHLQLDPAQSSNVRVTTTKDPPRKEPSCNDWCQSRPSKPYFEEQSCRCFSWWIQWTSWGQPMLLQMFSSTSWSSRCPSFRSTNQDVLQTVSTTRHDPCRLQGCHVGWFGGIGAGVQVERVCLRLIYLKNGQSLDLLDSPLDKSRPWYFSAQKKSRPKKSPLQ